MNMLHRSCLANFLRTEWVQPKAWPAAVRVADVLLFEKLDTCLYVSISKKVHSFTNITAAEESELAGRPWTRQLELTGV